MVLLRFVGGPWDGTDRDMPPDPETGSVLHVLYYTDDPEAGYYEVRGDRLPPDAGSLFEAFWVEHLQSDSG